MQTAELPRPHGEGPPVPPMWQAELDRDTLDRLFADLTADAEILSVRGKGAPGQYASTDPLTLTTARDRFDTGSLTGVQIRYRYDGREWTDTLLRVPGGYRLVRCQVSSL